MSATADRHAAVAEVEDPPESVAAVTVAEERPADRVTPLRSFTTAASREEVAARRRTLPFEIDGEPMTAYLPTDDQMVYVNRANSRTSDTSDKIDQMLLFLEGCTDTATYQHLEARTRDSLDGFGFSELIDVMTWLTDEWIAANPNKATRAPRTGPAAARPRRGR